jgi:hypothetical protein
MQFLWIGPLIFTVKKKTLDMHPGAFQTLCGYRFMGSSPQTHAGIAVVQVSGAVDGSLGRERSTSSVRFKCYLEGRHPSKNRKPLDDCTRLVEAFLPELLDTL